MMDADMTLVIAVASVIGAIWTYRHTPTLGADDVATDEDLVLVIVSNISKCAVVSGIAIGGVLLAGKTPIRPWFMLIMAALAVVYVVTTKRVQCRPKP